MSKKHTLSPAEYAAWQQFMQHQQPKKAKQHQPQPQQQPATKATSGGMDGLTVFLLALIGMMAAWGVLS